MGRRKWERRLGGLFLSVPTAFSGRRPCVLDEGTAPKTRPKGRPGRFPNFLLPTPPFHHLHQHPPRLAGSGGVGGGGDGDECLPQRPAACACPGAVVQRQRGPERAAALSPLSSVQAITRSQAGSPTAQQPKSITALSLPLLQQQIARCNVAMNPDRQLLPHGFQRRFPDGEGGGRVDLPLSSVRMTCRVSSVIDLQRAAPVEAVLARRWPAPRVCSPEVHSETRRAPVQIPPDRRWSARSPVSPSSHARTDHGQGKARHDGCPSASEVRNGQRQMWPQLAAASGVPSRPGPRSPAHSAAARSAQSPSRNVRLSQPPGSTKRHGQGRPLRKLLRDELPDELRCSDLGHGIRWGYGP